VQQAVSIGNKSLWFRHRTSHYPASMDSIDVGQNRQACRTGAVGSLMLKVVAVNMAESPEFRRVVRGRT
jgi:hypothetical protein